MRETHFKLGTWENKNKSESGHSFSFAEHYSPAPTVIKQGTHQSKVFRCGDWNKQNRNSLTASVTKKDYVKPSGSRPFMVTHEDQFADKNYHRATHFNLGSVRNSDVSVYNKDYTAGTVYANERQLIPSMNTLNLFPSNNQSTRNLSTKEDSYQNNGLETTIQKRKERMEILDEIRQRHCQESLSMHDSSRTPVKHLSITSSDFPKPPLVDTESSKNFIPAYNHLNGHYHGIETRASEARDAYVPHKNTSAQVRNECCERRRDNKSTHFMFGTTDIPSNYLRTEQSSQYQQPVSIPAFMQPAGKSAPQKKPAHSHLLTQYPAENQLLTGSIMKDDYRVPHFRLVVLYISYHS